MALKLGKCRLCLKLGDFYSIFTVDNAIQLSEMVMECTRIKVYDGDGMPDKICSECIQKLSSAYIFKQQCERSDLELRRNYVPPAGFTPPPPTRQSSDSAFSNHTDTSFQNKPSSSTEGKLTPANRCRKRSHESIDNASTSSHSRDFRPSSSRQIKEPKKNDKPKYQSDSDYDDNSASMFSADTDSDDQKPKEEFACKICSKAFHAKNSLTQHVKSHSRKGALKLGENAVVNIPKKSIEDAKDVEDKLSCEKCGKSFKLKIMLKRHHEICENSLKTQKELLVSLEPVDGVLSKFECNICSENFKTSENLQIHMRGIHYIKNERMEKVENTQKITVPCVYCHKPFDDYYLYTSHFNSCSKRSDNIELECPLCQRVLTKRNTYFTHIRNVHFERVNKPKEGAKKEFECRMCSKKLSSQNLLIKHLATHMSNIEGDEEESRISSIEDSASIPESEHTPNTSLTSGQPLKCSYCGKQFKIMKCLVTHELKHASGEISVKSEPPDKNQSSLLKEVYREESESSQDEGDDNTCDICEKQFSYKRLLLQHKRTKHNMSSGHKRAKINLKDCEVRCLICDIDMKVSDISEHNQTHISANIKPRNLYTCIECNVKFQSCHSLANHIKLVHRLKQTNTKVSQDDFEAPDLADFCEVVVTKAEPLDEVQSHNDKGKVPSTIKSTPLVDLNGFNCPLCGKKMNTLISLKRHVNWHSNVGNNIEKKMECFVCKEKFRFKSHYRLHMREHYTDTNLDPALLTCTICNRRSKHLRAAQAHMNYHKQTRFKNKDYECSICKRVFQYRRVYLSHMAIHFKRGESVQNTIVGDCIPNTKDKQNLDGTHTCHLCGKVCDSASSLKHHTSWHNSKTMLYGARHECTFCHLVFTNKRSQEIHIRTHYEDDNGPFKCQVCGKGYIDEGYFNRHVKGHNFDHQSHKKRIEKLRKDKVKCPICARFYPDLVRLIRHLRHTHPQSKMIKEDPDAPPQPYFSCKLCAKVFLDERRLKHHEEAHTRKHEFFKCKFCLKNSSSLKHHNIHIKSHLVRKYIDDPLQCPQCEEKLYKGYDLHYHLRDIHGITETWIADDTKPTLNGPLQEFQCSICLKVLASKGNYERHIDYHNTLRCNYCFDYFSSPRFLEGHQAFSCEKRKLIGDTEIHLRKIKCHICYKAFHVQVKLDCHLHAQHNIKVSREVTEGKKEFVCDYCFRVFENEECLISHKIYHRTVGYFGCIYCKKKFNTITLYRKHKNHHFAQLNVDNPTKCEHCDETFVAFRDMIYHMRDDHGDDKEWLVMPKESIEETCKICNKTFLNLHRHLEYHEENRCKKCGEYFFSRVDYDNHLCAIESDDEVENLELSTKPPYEECRFCFKPITKKDSKLKHDKIHRGSGAISCRFCPLKFKTLEAFNIHAFTHRSRKYNKKPLKCRKCGEKFVKYGPFMKHLKSVHKSVQKMHYRSIVKAERCIVCGDDFPNLHNHYRAHLQNRCQLCRKYFTSLKVFNFHECDKEDLDPSKVFVCDEDLQTLIKTYVPKDEEEDDQKFYGYDDNEKTLDFNDDASQNSAESEPLMAFERPIISGVQSLYEKEIEKLSTDDSQDAGEKQDDHNGDVIDLIDDDSVDVECTPIQVITIDE